jgi:hypothetical protein
MTIPLRCNMMRDKNLSTEIVIFNQYILSEHIQKTHLRTIYFGTTESHDNVLKILTF